MSGILKVFAENLFQFDALIFVLGVVDLCVFLSARKAAQRVYDHFNLQKDRVSRLPATSKSALLALLNKDAPSLSATELMGLRAKTNKLYAVFTTITSIFPLMGMLGTVWSLLQMVDKLGVETTGAFFSALTSTFWGIVFAMGYKLADSQISYKIEDNEKRMEFYLNPKGEEQTDETERTAP